MPKFCKYVAPGNVADIIPGANRTAGQVQLVGTRVTIISKNMTGATTLGTTSLEGIWDVPQAAEIIAAGTLVYWDAAGDPVGGTAGTGAFTATAGGNNLAGVAVPLQPNGTGSTAITDEFVRIKLAGVSINVAAIGGSMTADDITGSDPALTITGEAGAAAGAGGTVIVTGGAGDDTGAGGAVGLTGGASGAGATGNGGVSAVAGGAAASTNGAGGMASVIGGLGTGTGAGGECRLRGGAAGASGTGGAVLVTGGAATTGNGGAVTLTGGASATLGNGGAASLVGGAATTNGVGGEVNITGGAGATAGSGGTITLTPGAGAGAGRAGLIRHAGISTWLMNDMQTHTDTAALSAAKLRGRFITGTPTAAATYTLPTGAQMTTEFPNIGDNEAFEFFISNVATDATYIITLAAGAQFTIVGSVGIPSNSNTTGGVWGTSTGRFLAKRTDAANWVCYRV